MSENGFLRLRLASQSAGDLASLVAQICGQSTDLSALPYLAPALLLADDRVQQALTFPTVGAGEVLVQDYQAITYFAAFPLNGDLVAQTVSELNGPAAKYDFSMSDDAGCDLVRLKTAVRLFPVTELLAAKGTQFRAPTLTATTWGEPILASQAQIDRYLDLSGDRNPIHREGGWGDLGRPIVPGLLLVSLIQPYCERALPKASLMSLKARFLAPLFVGDTIRIGVQRRGGARLRAYLLGQDDRALAIADLVLN